MNEHLVQLIKDDARFSAYFDLLIDWNGKTNLTSITERDDVYKKHFLDSILPIDLIPHGAKVLDIGAGAGFPSVPLKLVRSDLKMTMIDSVAKKVNFLNETIDKLCLNNIIAIHTRIEDLKVFDFDVVIARAVAPLNILVEYGLPFLKIGGFLLAYKSSEIIDEISSAQNALRVLGGVVDNLVTLPLDRTTCRSFVVVKKREKTPKNYPRSANKPRLNPL